MVVQSGKSSDRTAEFCVLCLSSFLVILALWYSNFFSLSLLCLSPSFAVCSDPFGMNTFLIPSPLPHPHSLKIAALLNRLSLSFICHSPHHAPHSQTLCFLFILSLAPSPPHTSHLLCIHQCIAQQSYLYIIFP